MADTVLLLAHGMTIVAAMAGLIYLRAPSPKALAFTRISAGATVAAYGLWFGMVSETFSYCVLRDLWGMISLAAVFGILAAEWADWRWRMPRVLVGTLLVIALTTAFARGIHSGPEGRVLSQGNWLLPFHVLLTVVGYTAMTLGCVTGLLFLLRSRGLKRAVSSPPEAPSVPWPALTTLDRLFVRSTGWGMLLLGAGTLLGVGAFRKDASEGLWYADPRVVLTVVGGGLYLLVWWLHRRQGFCTRRMVGLGTIGFACLLLALVMPDLFARGIHRL